MGVACANGWRRPDYYRAGSNAVALDFPGVPLNFIHQAISASFHYIYKALRVSETVKKWKDRHSPSSKIKKLCKWKNRYIYKAFKGFQIIKKKKEGISPLFVAQIRIELTLPNGKGIFLPHYITIAKQGNIPNYRFLLCLLWPGLYLNRIIYIYI